jgi:putative membrane protein
MSHKQMVRQVLGASLLAASACSHFRRGPSSTTAQPAASKAASTPAKPVTAAPAPATTTARAATPAKVEKAKPAAPAKPVKGPSDANIAAFVLAANNSDISYARLAATRSQSPAVKQFASQMLADESGVNQAVGELLTRKDLNAEDYATSLAYRDESALRRDQLREADGRGFDATYLSNEIAHHTKLLATIDGSLMPSARTPDLKRLLASIRPTVAAHLAQAQELQASLGSK